MKTLATLFRNNVREYGMLIALIAIMAFFQYQTGGILLRPINITNLVLQNSYIIVMALGMLLIIVLVWESWSRLIRFTFHWGGIPHRPDVYE